MIKSILVWCALIGILVFAYIRLDQMATAGANLIDQTIKESCK